METFGSFGMYYLHGAVCSWYAVCQARDKFHREVWIVWLPDGPQIGEWHRIRIDVAGNEISYYIDDELKHQNRNDSLHTSGGVSLYAYNSIAEFDNVVITADDIPDMGPSGYAVEHGNKLAATWGLPSVFLGSAALYGLGTVVAALVLPASVPPAGDELESC